MFAGVRVLVPVKNCDGIAEEVSHLGRRASYVSVLKDQESRHLLPRQAVVESLVEREQHSHH